MYERALRQFVDGAWRAMRLDGVAQLVCGPCCETGDCYYRFTPCNTGGPCGINGPDIYVPCSAVCPSDGEPIGARVIHVPGDPDLAGWCWRNSNDPDCPRYTTEDPPPSGYCLAPPDAILVDEGWECVPDCSDPVCSRRGEYLIPDLCENQCGPQDRQVLVCPEPGMDLSRCRYSRAKYDQTGGFCGCVVIGPHSRPYDGDPTGYDIIYATDAWAYALDPQAACCECCTGGAFPCDRCVGEQVPRFGITCIPSGAGRFCCCSDTRRVFVVAFGAWRESRQGASLLTTLDRKSNFITTTRLAYNGSGWDATCLGVTARETFLQEQYRDGNLIFRQYDQDSRDECNQGEVTLSGDLCVITGQEMAQWSGGFRVWRVAETNNTPNNWGTILQEINLLIDPSAFRCSGSAPNGCLPNQNCTGSWNTVGGCGSGSFAGSIAAAYEDGGEQISRSASLRVSLYTVIEQNFPDCEGGCGFKQPRKIGDGPLGAGDIL